MTTRTYHCPIKASGLKKLERSLSIAAWSGNTTNQHHQEIRKVYYGCVSFVDDEIKHLIQSMEAQAPVAMENTWIIFTSDHGDMLGEHNLWRKIYAYESCVRLPMIICPPKD
jgi:arylsulfatase A-like enzyme